MMHEETRQWLLGLAASFLATDKLDACVTYDILRSGITYNTLFPVEVGRHTFVENMRLSEVWALEEQ